MSQKTFYYLLFIALTACTSHVINYEIIDSGISSGKRFASFYFDVITEEEKFNRLFREIHSDQLPPPVPPAIDFRNSFVLIASTGEKPTTGYSVSIDQIARHDDVLKVKLQITEPSTDKKHAMMLTQPFVMVKIQKYRDLDKVEFFDQDSNILDTLPIP